MIKKILRNCLVVALLFLTKNVNATDYYISTTGSDGATGLVGFPKATLASIFSTYNLASGDVINVAAGTYTEKGIIVGSNDELLRMVIYFLNTNWKLSNDCFYN